jgi:hypothetical protein
MSVFYALQASKRALERRNRHKRGMKMNRPLLNRSFLQGLIWGGVLVLSATLALAQDPADQNVAPGNAAPENTVQAAAAAGGARTDGQIEMDVVHALDTSQALKNDLITAATIQSEVTLAGTVSADASKTLAESIVSKVPGVTKVHNNLTVGDPQQAQNAQDATQPQPADESDPGQPRTPPQDANSQANNQGGQPDSGPMPPPQAYPQRPPQQYPQQGQYPPQGQQYPQQGQYPPPYPQGRPQYGPYGAPEQGYNQPPAYAPATGPVTVPQGTLLQVRTNEPVTSKRAVDGTAVQFTVISDVTMGGALAIPRGATVHGVVTEVKNVGRGDLGGSSALALTLTSLDLGGQNYPITSDQFRVKGPNKAGQTVGSAVTGGLIGTIIGCAAGRGVGCAVGAGAGVAAGTAASAASSGPGVWIPAEALVSFHLTAPVTLNPVSQQEAARLAQGLFQGGPSLYRRPGYPYGARYYAGYGYPYYYPPVYYRPYYMAGGYYYWR